MAETILFDDGPSDQYEEHLSDDQMLKMLERAAKRKQETLALTAVRGAGDDDSAATKFNFPKLNTGEVARPYVSTDGKVAQMDAARLLQDKDRLLAKGFRKVEDPIVVKKQAAEVRFDQKKKPPSSSVETFFVFTKRIFIFVYEENIPNLFS